jgi:hypothetical protein
MNNKLILGLGAMAAAALYYFKGKTEAIKKIQITPLDIAINSQKSLRAQNWRTWLTLNPRALIA